MSDSITKHDIRAELEERARQWQSIGHSDLLSLFVLRNGVILSGDKRPKGVRKQRSRFCFENSAHEALHGKLGCDYFEGIAISDLGMPVHHAWCVQDGVVVDLTWRYPEKCTYMGVHIDAKTLTVELLRNKTHGILDTGGGYNTEFMFGRDPYLKSIILDRSNKRAANQR